MALDTRFHALFFGYLLLLGLTDLMVAMLGQPTCPRLMLGPLFIAIAVYQLFEARRSVPEVFAVQRVD